MKKMVILLAGCIVAILLNACAFDLVHVKQTPAQLTKDSSKSESFTLEEEVKVKLGTGYSRKLNKGTTWQYVGNIPQGDVFKTDDQILTIEGSHIYEAYIVVSAAKLVGFYLPVEQSFSPISDQKMLKTMEISQDKMQAKGEEK